MEDGSADLCYFDMSACVGVEVNIPSKDCSLMYHLRANRFASNGLYPVLLCIRENL